MLLLESAIPQACLSVGVCMSAQLCLTLHDPLDSSPPGSSVHRILQVRTLPFPPPGDLHHPGIKPSSLASPALAGGFSTTEPPEKPSIGDWGFFLA